MIALGALVYLELSTVEHQQISEPQRRPSVPALPATSEETVVGEAARLTLRLHELDLPVPLPSPKEEQLGNPGLQWTHRIYDLTLPRPRQLEPFTEPVLKLRAENPLVTVQVEDHPQHLELRLGVAGLRTHTLRFRWLDRPPRAALFVAGLGRDLVLARRLLELPARITYAVDPTEPFADVIAERLKLAGAATWLQVNLSQAYSSGFREEEQQPKLPDGDSSVAELESLLTQALARIPSVQGVLVLAQAERLAQAPLAVIHAVIPAGIPVVVTGSGQQASELCAWLRERKRPCLATSTDLPDNSTPEETASRILMAVARAQLLGDAIEVLAASEATLQAIGRESPRFPEVGVELVDAATLVGELGLSQR